MARGPLNGKNTLMKNAREFEDKVYALVAEFSRMADAACERRDTNAVHWLVSEERKLANLIRLVEMRGYNK